MKRKALIFASCVCLASCSGSGSGPVSTETSVYSTFESSSLSTPESTSESSSLSLESEKEVCEIDFSCGGGSPVPSIECYKGEELSFDAKPSKEHFFFEGWYLDESLTTPLPNPFVVEKSLTLYAKYIPSHVLMTYMVGKDVYQADYVKIGEKAVRPTNDPSKVGFRFSFWEVDGKPFDFLNPVTENTLLQARFDIEPLELPIIQIETDGHQDITSKKDYLSAIFSLSNVEDGQQKEALECGIRGRGNSTWDMAKKPYRLKFNKKQSLFGSSYKAKSWVLLAEYTDKSLSRNALAFALSASQPNTSFACSSQHVELYLNGEYKGVYLLTDQPQTGDGRVEIDETLTPDGDTGYFLELNPRIKWEGYTEGVHFFESQECVFEIKTPDTDGVEYLNNPSLYSTFIKSYMDECFVAMDGDKWEEVVGKMDVASFVDSYIVQELFKDPDCGTTSFYLVKDKGGKLKTGPAWDFDISAGNCNYIVGDENEASPTDALHASEANPFFKRLLRFEEFKTMVANALSERKSDLKDVIELANPLSNKGYYQKYRQSFNRNFEEWKIMGYYCWPQPKAVYSLGDVKAQLGYLYSWLNARLDFVIEQYPTTI